MTLPLAPCPSHCVPRNLLLLGSDRSRYRLGSAFFKMPVVSLNLDGWAMAHPLPSSVAENTVLRSSLASCSKHLPPALLPPPLPPVAAVEAVVLKRRKKAAAKLAVAGPAEAVVPKHSKRITTMLAVVGLGHTISRAYCNLMRKLGLISVEGPVSAKAAGLDQIKHGKDNVNRPCRPNGCANATPGTMPSQGPFRKLNHNVPRNGPIKGLEAEDEDEDEHSSLHSQSHRPLLSLLRASPPPLVSSSTMPVPPSTAAASAPHLGAIFVPLGISSSGGPPSWSSPAIPTSLSASYLSVHSPRRHLALKPPQIRCRTDREVVQVQTEYEPMLSPGASPREVAASRQPPGPSPREAATEVPLRARSPPAAGSLSALRLPPAVRSLSALRSPLVGGFPWHAALLAGWERGAEGEGEGDGRAADRRRRQGGWRGGCGGGGGQRGGRDRGGGEGGGGERGGRAEEGGRGERRLVEKKARG
uniref:Uncharacterized protein n=1 Tax=Oryza punctata TaxID=4537 RepID=A0A0E0KIM7_ORYPU